MLHYRRQFAFFSFFFNLIGLLGFIADALVFVLSLNFNSTCFHRLIFNSLELNHDSCIEPLRMKTNQPPSHDSHLLNLFSMYFVFIFFRLLQSVLRFNGSFCVLKFTWFTYKWNNFVIILPFNWIKKLKKSSAMMEMGEISNKSINF